MADTSYLVDRQSDIESRKERYGRSYTDFGKMVNYFNLSKLPDYDNMAEPYIAYIFMSRPMLNISAYGGVSDEYAAKNYQALQQNSMTAAYANDKYGKQLLHMLSEYSGNAWLPIITTKAMSYSVGDVELKTVEKGNTYFGHVLKYGKHSEDHKVSGTISIDFRNDRYLSILKTMYLWMCYIYIVSKSNSIQPKLINQRNAILDYPASLYYLITRRDGRELVYWEKLTGIFPIKSPLSIFSYSDNMILEDRVNIDFSYGIRSDPCDPNVLMDINFLSGDTYSNILSKSKTSGKLYSEKFLNNKEAPFVKGDVYARNPYIQMKKLSDGSLKYYLGFEG